MSNQHTSLANGRWQTLSLAEQLANIGSEVERALRWKSQGNEDYSRLAFERALELLDLSLATKLTAAQFSELTRVREALVDYFMGDNLFSSTPKSWRTYFGAFTYLSRLRQGA
ncbi:hypothetical protein KGQ71_02035 [Patescibacteria group bacterium]|nr:hypothetical protein [Patescibacteria group bacterium]